MKTATSKTENNSDEIRSREREILRRAVAIVLDPDWGQVKRNSKGDVTHAEHPRETLK